MAQLLVMARSNGHQTPEKDRSGSYKRGDVVVVFGDRHRWGRDELLPASQGGAFRIVRVPGFTAEQLQAEVRRVTGLRLNEEHHRGGEFQSLRRRRLALDPNCGDVLTLAELLSALVDKTKR